MKAVLLAGSFDWGDCPLTAAAPRGLVPVANQPLIAYGLAALKRAGANEVVICANGSTSAFGKVVSRLAIEGVHLHYLKDQMPRGPAGCVRDAAQLLEADHLVAVEGALLPELDILELYQAHLASGAALTVGVDQAAPAGGWREGLSPHAAGVYVFSSDCLPHVPAKGYQDIKEGLIPKLNSAGERVEARSVRGLAPRVTGPESYLSINGWVLERMAAGQLEHDGYERRGDLFVHPTARVAPSVCVAGPVIVGPGAVVEDDAILIGPTSIGPQAEVGAGAVVCNSILWEQARVGAKAHVDEAVLAMGAAVAPEAEVSRTVRQARASSPGVASVARMLKRAAMNGDRERIVTAPTPSMARMNAPS